MKSFQMVILFMTALVSLSSCGIYDLRTKSIKQNGIESAKVEKGKDLLDKAWKTQGMDKLEQFQTYSFTGKDTWKGPLGSVGKVWKDNITEMVFHYRIGSFDGQVKFLNGQDQGSSSGLQNWSYYDIIDEEPAFSGLDLKKNRRKVFAIAAFQYFTELIDRLREAPIISYAGEASFRGQAYDLVFCTWQSPEPHMEHDQYVVWINKETSLLEFAQFTIRDSYLKAPGYKKIGGAIEFTDLREIEGIRIPHQQIIYGFNLKENPKKYLHKLDMTNFKFDAFEESKLQVNKSLPLGADTKALD